MDPVTWALALHDAVADPLAWLVVGLFLAGTVAETRSRTVARRLLLAGWVAFGLFWAVQVPHFAFAQKSFVEGIGTLVAVPASLYVGYLLARGRDSLFVLSRAVAVMGVVYLPFETSALLRGALIEAVAGQTEFLMGLLGHHPEVVSGAEVAGENHEPFRNTFRFYPAEDHVVTYTIVLACTGIGSMAIFAGLIAAVRAPLSRKLRAFAVSIPVIYALNLVRNVFIGLSFGNQYAHVFPELVLTVFATDDPYLVSYFVADRVVAQVLSVVALVGITWLVVRELPEVLVVVEDVLYVLTGTEYELGEALGRPTVAPDAETEVGSAD